MKRSGQKDEGGRNGDVMIFTGRNKAGQDKKENDQRRPFS